MRHISLLLGAVAFAVQQAEWQKDFTVAKSDFVSTGHNDYFSLEPGKVLTLTHENERLVITVTNETKVIDGVTTRVVEERETANGELVEVSRNYFAVDRKTNDVYYFGESVDIYKNGKVVNHEGSWEAGTKGATYGLAMPAKPVVHRRYFQEVAPGLAMDRAEIVSLTATVAGSPAWKNCLKVEETTPLEPGVKEYKYYAAGVGLVQDGDLKLRSRN